MPTKTIILLAAIVGMIILLVISIVITVIATGNVLAKKGEEDRPNSKFLLYVKNVERFKCPKCGGPLKLYLGKDHKNYYRCRDMQHCDYIVDPDELLAEKK